MSETDDLARRLLRIDCCAVSDALDKLGLPASVSGLPPRSSSRRIAGRVHTVKLVAKDKAPPATGAPRHLGTTAIEACQPGEIIVVEQRTGIDAGSWGGILSLGAKMRGVAGVIADGPVRDIDEAIQIDFPVFCPAATARTARNRVAEIATDIPVPDRRCDRQSRRLRHRRCQRRRLHPGRRRGAWWPRLKTSRRARRR